MAEKLTQTSGERTRLTFSFRGRFAKPLKGNTKRKVRDREGAIGPSRTGTSTPGACAPQKSRVHVRRASDRSAHEIQDGRERQHDSGHQKFAKRSVGENPDDREDCQSRHNFHSRKIERLTI